MNYGVLGTGNVAQTIASKLIELGHHVMMGSRTAQNEKAVKWVSENGSRAECGTFADAAAFGERVFNCVQGIHAIEVLQHLGRRNSEKTSRHQGREDTELHRKCDDDQPQ